jgi:hypothetical protein
MPILAAVFTQSYTEKLRFCVAPEWMQFHFEWRDWFQLYPFTSHLRAGAILCRPSRGWNHKPYALVVYKR